MCKRNLLTALRSISYAVLIFTFVSFVVLSLNQTILDSSSSRSRNFTAIDVFLPPEPLNKPPVKLIYVTKREIRSVISHTTRILRCPGEMRTGYCVIRNYYRAKMYVGYNESVTLSTQGTLQFLKHAEELCKRWQGPISVAVYAPGSDFQYAKEEILRLRECGHSCVQNWVTWHFVFDAEHKPPSHHISSKSHRSSKMCNNLHFQDKSFIDSYHLVYPINVARNVARLSSNTHYVFASDIELYPSQGIIPKFLKMVHRLSSDPTSKTRLSSKRHVFVFRVFEVDKKVKTVPSRKEELATLYKKNLAIFFHRYMCFTCHRIPNLLEWLRTKTTEDELTISMTTKRQISHGLGDWEPFFIGTNDEPLFDERLTWNGKANKMQVALELCLMDYDLHILDDAFLVHIPGIKKFSYEVQKPRVPYMRKNRANFLIITKELYKKYGNRTECK